jgi:hypothetical protein
MMHLWSVINSIIMAKADDGVAVDSSAINGGVIRKILLSKLIT